MFSYGRGREFTRETSFLPSYFLPRRCHCSPISLQNTHTHTQGKTTLQSIPCIHLLFRDRQRDRNTWQLTYLSRLVLSLSRCNPSLRFHPHLPAIQPGREKANPNLLAAFHFVFVIYSSLFIKPSWTGIKKKTTNKRSGFPQNTKLLGVALV